MIHIVGTCHKTQLWTDLVRKKALGAAPLSKVAAFEKFVRDTATTLQATVIAEELSEDTVLNYGYNAESVAVVVARDLNIRHIFCERNRRDAQSLVEFAPGATERALVTDHPKAVSERFAIRENWWATQLALFSPNTTDIVFICGAAHCETFPATLKHQGAQARIHCLDWTLTSEIPCPCCMDG
jgi:hypothetical protein